jgi:hypothetical protein
LEDNEVDRFLEGKIIPLREFLNGKDVKGFKDSGGISLLVWR